MPGPGKHKGEEGGVKQSVQDSWRLHVSVLSSTAPVDLCVNVLQKKQGQAQVETRELWPCDMHICSPPTPDLKREVGMQGS